MKYFLFGDDALALRARKQELIQRFSQDNPGAPVFSFQFSSGNGDIGKLEEEILPTLFGTPKLIVVEDLESMYSGAKERIENILSTPTAADIIFIEYKKLPKADAFLKLAKKYIESDESYDAKKRDLQKFITLLEEKLGGHLDARTIAALKERSEKDDDLVLQNIQKVLTYSQGKPISQDELDALVPTPVEAKVFDALDALAAGQKERAFSLFHLLLKEEDIFRIFPLCAWQIRQMLLVTAGKEHFGENKEKIAKEAGIHPFVVQKLLRVLPGYPRTRLAKGLRILSELDVDLKQGRKTPEGALQHFVFQW